MLRAGLLAFLCQFTAVDGGALYLEWESAAILAEDGKSNTLKEKTEKILIKKLKVLIQEMQAERQALKDRAQGVTPPDKLTKTQKKIWTYMKFHSDVTSYRAIARGAGVTRHTAAKWYEMMREMLGRAA